MKKILLGMSGGVDSSAAAVILKNAGYEVAGVTLRLYDNADLSDDHKGKTCCSLKDVEDARSAAYRVGIEHYVFNFGDDFRRDVMQSFCDSVRVISKPQKGTTVTLTKRFERKPNGE